MVFFQKQMTRAITVHPMFLGPALRQHVRDQLVAEVEGTPVDNAGFIITVLKIEDEPISKGLVDAMTGFVKYNVDYTALMFRPFKNEVLDAVVKSVSEIGFFAEAGPLSIAVSNANMPDDMEFSPEDGSYTSSETGVKIRAEHAVRIKIIGATILQSTLCAIGSIKEPYLGLLA